MYVSVQFVRLLIFLTFAKVLSSFNKQIWDQTTKYEYNTLQVNVQTYRQESNDWFWDALCAGWPCEVTGHVMCMLGTSVVTPPLY